MVLEQMVHKHMVLDHKSSPKSQKSILVYKPTERLSQLQNFMDAVEMYS